MIYYSWSELVAALSCLRKYELAYIERLERVVSAEDYSRVFGTAVHAGLEESDVLKATQAARAAIEAAIENAQAEEDLAVYQLALAEISPFMAYYFPRLPKFQFLEREASFEIPMTDTWGIRGRYDAYVYDPETNQYGVVDYKTRRTMPSLDEVCMDGQLFMYALALHEQGKPVDFVAQINMKTQPPQPAKINKDGTPSIAAQATTKERWLETLPAGINPAVWLSKLEDKFHLEEDFLMVARMPITQVALDTTRINLYHSVNLLIGRKDFPAIYSSNVCKYCEFRLICSSARYGVFDAEVMTKYKKKD